MTHTESTQAIKNQVLKQNSTHKAVRNGDYIDIIIKGYEDLWADEFAYNIRYEDKDDLFAIFERLDEDNRINLAEANGK